MSASPDSPGVVIRKAREALGISVREVSEARGVDPSVQRRLEGSTNPTWDSLCSAASALGVSLYVSVDHPTFSRSLGVGQTAFEFVPLLFDQEATLALADELDKRTSCSRRVCDLAAEHVLRVAESADRERELQAYERREATGESESELSWVDRERRYAWAVHAALCGGFTLIDRQDSRMSTLRDMTLVEYVRVHALEDPGALANARQLTAEEVEGIVQLAKEWHEDSLDGYRRTLELIHAMGYGVQEVSGAGGVA